MSDPMLDQFRDLLARAARAGEPESWSVPISKADLRALIERAARVPNDGAAPTISAAERLVASAELRAMITGLSPHAELSISRSFFPVDYLDV